MSAAVVSDGELADILVARLNALLADADVRRDVQRLLDVGVVCSSATRDHATIQVGESDGRGYVAAVLDDIGNLVTFMRTPTKDGGA